MKCSFITIQLWPISLLYCFIFITELKQMPYMELHMQAAFQSDVYNQQYWNISFNQTINRDRMCPGGNQVFSTMTWGKATTNITASPVGSWLLFKWKNQCDLLGEIVFWFCTDTAFFPTGFAEAVACSVFPTVLPKSLSVGWCPCCHFWKKCLSPQQTLPLCFLFWGSGYYFWCFGFISLVNSFPSIL